MYAAWRKSNLPHGAGHICDVNLSKVAHYMMRQAAKFLVFTMLWAFSDQICLLARILTFIVFKLVLSPSPRTSQNPKKKGKDPEAAER